MLFQPILSIEVGTSLINISALFVFSSFKKVILRNAIAGLLHQQPRAGQITQLPLPNAIIVFFTTP
jgi:hypothetical protein